MSCVGVMYQPYSSVSSYLSSSSTPAPPPPPVSSSPTSTPGYPQDHLAPLPLKREISEKVRVRFIWSSSPGSLAAMPAPPDSLPTSVVVQRVELPCYISQAKTVISIFLLTRYSARERQGKAFRSLCNKAQIVLLQKGGGLDLWLLLIESSRVFAAGTKSGNKYESIILKSVSLFYARTSKHWNRSVQVTRKRISHTSLPGISLRIPWLILYLISYSWLSRNTAFSSFPSVSPDF